MGWVHIGGVSPQLTAEQPPAAGQSPAPGGTNPPPDNRQDGGAPVSHLSQEQREAEFFKIRDALRKESVKEPDGGLDSPPELLKKLTEVIGPIKVDGFQPGGRALPAVISNDPDRQIMDSLEFKNYRDEWLNVTTLGLAKNFRPGAASPLDYIGPMVPLVSFAAFPDSGAYQICRSSRAWREQELSGPCICCDIQCTR